MRPAGETWFMSPPSLTQSAAGTLRRITHLCLFPASTKTNQRETLAEAREYYNWFSSQHGAVWVRRKTHSVSSITQPQDDTRHRIARLVRQERQTKIFPVECETINVRFYSRFECFKMLKSNKWCRNKDENKHAWRETVFVFNDRHLKTYKTNLHWL